MYVRHDIKLGNEFVMALLWAGFRAARGKTTIGVAPTCLNYFEIL